MKKNLTIILFLLLITAINALGQSVSYAYDNSGNRTARTFSLLRSANAQDEVTSFIDVLSEKSIMIYPNPTKGLFYVEIKDYSDKLSAEFRLSDMSGRTIITRKANSNLQTFDLSRQAAGIYLLQIRINGESVVWKIIKE